MLELNKVMLVGNLTFDPDYRMTPSGRAVAGLRMAVNRRYTNRDSGERTEETLFIDVTVWGKSADFCRDYLSKGRRIYVEGRLNEERWDDKETGQKRSKIKVLAERVQFADSKPSGDESDREQRRDDNRSGGSQRSSSRSSTQGDDFSDDDLPF